MTDNVTKDGNAGKWTPGPWRVVIDEDAAQVAGFPCIEADGYTVVGIEGMYDDIDTDFANARLVASAPDMLEALREVVDTCRADCPAGLDALRAARAAIARATGDAQ